MINLSLSKDIKNYFITGPPGVGKTTFILALSKKLGNMEFSGFYTKEIRNKGKREGFQISTFNGLHKTFAHVKIISKFKVSKYGINIQALDDIISYLIIRKKYHSLWLIDEIGKMESYSGIFRSFINDILEQSIPVVATISLYAGGWIKEIRNRSDVELINLEESNRIMYVDILAQELKTKINP